MKTSQYSAADISALLLDRKIATMAELLEALGTGVRRTAFRKLKELKYRSSYSHRGSFYTLDQIAEFDPLGLWTYSGVQFSIHGTLLATAAALVETSDAGYYVDELDNALAIGTKDALRKLVRDERLTREEFAGRYLYCSGNSSRQRQQLLSRRTLLAAPGAAGPLPGPSIMPPELRAAIVLFFSMLDEKQRRLYAGLEALKTGHGGDVQVAALLGLDPSTVARGRRELLGQDVEVDRVRQAGGGRKPIEKKRQT